jgi:hypothetical protein
MNKTRPGRRFFLPPGYSLACKPKGSTHEFMFTKPHGMSTPFTTAEDAARAAWDDAGLPVHDRLSEPV